jgi:hypothetical protein
MATRSKTPATHVEECVLRLQSVTLHELQLVETVGIPHSADESPVDAFGDLFSGERSARIVRLAPCGLDSMLDRSHLTS